LEKGIWVLIEMCLVSLWLPKAYHRLDVSR
jgi:hypothetical protein